jgi:twitching motility protein PilT
MNSGASDVHVVPYHPPVMVLHKKLGPVPGYDVVTPEDTRKMVLEMVGQKGMDSLMERRDWDFSHKIAGVGRYRVNAHFQRECIAICFRTIKSNVPPLDGLNLPPVVKKLTELPRGLVLMTGPTGSGKSTTLASLIDRMNQSQSRHVITIEDPIEYELVSNQCLIEQREFGSDVPSFASGLKHALRQAPDVILVGEMRDLETTTAAISAAETGHLVLSTLHTQSASQTIERIIDIYPPEQQRYILSMLSNTLQAVVTQTLFTQSSGQGMVPALEVMICNSAV